MDYDIYYAPILKGKANDIKALGDVPASLARHMLPTLEFLSPPDRTKTELQLVRFADNLRKFCPTQRMNIDLFSIHPEDMCVAGGPLLEAAFRYMRAQDLPFIPVYGLYYSDPSLWDRIFPIAKQGNRGVTFRLEREDIGDADDVVEEVARKMEAARIAPRYANMLIDLKSIADIPSGDFSELVSTTHDLIEAISATGIGHIAVVGSSMPRDVSRIPKNGYGRIRREELRLWADLQVGARPHKIAFGDYGVVWPNFSDKGPAPNANAKIRYTAGEYHHIFRGDKLLSEERYGTQYGKLAQRVVNAPIFCGPSFSKGDAYLFGRARGSEKGRSLGVFVYVDTAHHLTYVAQQVSRGIAAIPSTSTSEQLVAAML
jgi:Beta protein